MGNATFFHRVIHITPTVAECFMGKAEWDPAPLSSTVPHSLLLLEFYF